MSRRKGPKPIYGVKAQPLTIMAPPELLRRITDEALARNTRERVLWWNSSRVAVAELARHYGVEIPEKASK